MLSKITPLVLYMKFLFLIDTICKLQYSIKRIAMTVVKCLILWVKLLYLQKG